MTHFNTRCHIRAATEHDTALLASWWADGSVMEHAGFPHGLKTDLDALHKRLKSQSNSNIIWIIEYPENNPIGEMNHRIKGRKAEIGIKLCVASSQNKGLGSEALKWLIHMLFMDYDIDAIVLDTMIENTRAQAVYEKLHFKRIDRLENCWQDQLGRWRTAYLYELTSADYKRYYRSF